jgi:hypothetical protein
LMTASVARQVGIWRFLFGTDGVDVRSAYSMYKNQFGFDENEAKQVIFKNGHDFLIKVIWPIKQEKQNIRLIQGQ